MYWGAEPGIDMEAHFLVDSALEPREPGRHGKPGAAGRKGRRGMERDRDILILLAEEQTLLSRERTMHSYMQTGLAFASVGLVIIKFLGGLLYVCAGGLFMALGGLLILESAKRYTRFRKAVRALREKEASLGYEVGSVR